MMARNIDAEGGQRRGILGRLPRRPVEESGPAAPWGVFLRAAIPDFLLVLLVSTALVMTVSFAFESAPDARGNALLDAALCVPMLVILYLGSRSRSAVLPAAIAACVWAAVLIGVGVAATPADVPVFVDNVVNDVPESYLLFATVAAVVPVMVFILSRRTVGMAFLLVGGIIACAWVQFIYRDWADNHGLAVSLAVYIGIGMLFVFQTYRSSMLSAKRAKKTSFAIVVAYAVGIVAVCAGVGAALFFGVVAPAELHTFDLRPFQRYYAVPVVEYSGVYSNVEVEDPDATTDQTDDDMKDANQDSQGGQEPDDSEDPKADPTSPVEQFLSQFDADSWTQSFEAINYEKLLFGAFVVVAVVVAALAAAICARRARRERRLKEISDKSTVYQVQWLYNFLCERFGRMKIERPDTLTPMEFALGSQRRLAQFSEGTAGVDFVRVTDIYQRSNFGAEQLSDEELADVKAYYRAFFANARRYLGNVRWLWKFWRI